MSVETSTTIAFTLNGLPVEYCGPGGRRLLDVIRIHLGLTGTKEGCGEGECGACSVLLDGEVAASCLVPVCQVRGRTVTTVEGLTVDGLRDPLETAFLEAGAVQCGFCTPGMLVAARAFIDSGAPRTEERVREAIAGNLCRCTGYAKIVEAIVAAAPAPGAGRAGPREAAAGPGVATAGLPVQVAESADGPDVAVPRSLDEALRRLAAGPCRPIAGGTDVMVALAPAGPPAPASQGPSPAPPMPAEAPQLVDISGLAELRGIRLDGDELSIGALTTYAELRRSPLIAEHLPVLAEAAALVGAAQIQNRGTIGGNVMTASPAGDMLPILLATDATLVLQSVRGERRIPAAAFWTAYRRTAATADELLLRICIPLRPGRRVRFRKVGTRRAQAISKVVIAVAWDEVGEAWRDVRVALGSVAPQPIRVPRTEGSLEGTVPAPGLAEEAAAILAAELDPIDDVRSTAAYRRAAAARVLRRIVVEEGARQRPQR